jgi:hypothetical protein
MVECGIIFLGLENYALDDVRLGMGRPTTRAMVVVVATSFATTCFRILVSSCYLQNMKYF